MVQWLGLHPFTVKGVGSIPSQGTKILQGMRYSQKERRKEIVRLKQETVSWPHSKCSVNGRCFHLNMILSGITRKVSSALSSPSCPSLTQKY